MKLGFKHSGRQFFFITMVVAERREVLSRVVDESSRPELTRLGEVVVFALRAIHRVWPAATVSDFVIMPDHLHFLLIVDYGNDATFSPLFVAHRLADAVEMAAERTGDAPEPPKEQPTDREAKRALDERKIVFMAARLREAIVAANEAAVRGELKVVKGLRCGEKVVAGSGAINGASLAGGSGAAAPVRSVVFARDCYIELSFDSRQLKAVRHYIKLNPARRLWKLRHHDLFVCHRAIKAARLVALAPRQFDGLGDLTLLGSPFLFHVRLTLRSTSRRLSRSSKKRDAAGCRFLVSFRQVRRRPCGGSRQNRPRGSSSCCPRRCLIATILRQKIRAKSPQGGVRYRGDFAARDEARPRRSARLSPQLSRTERHRRRAMRIAVVKNPREKW